MVTSMRSLTSVELDLLVAAGIDSHSTVRRPEQGQDNSVVIIDEQWVVRVAKTLEARGYHANELAVLEALPRSCAVPRPCAAHDGGIVYPFLPGESLDRTAWSSLGPDAQVAVAEQIRHVLTELHALAVDSLPDPIDRLDTDWVRSSIRTCSRTSSRRPLSFEPRSLLERFESAWALEYWQSVIVHVDLKPSNLLIDGDLASVIDFGGLSMADPALDYGVLSHHLGNDVLDAMGIAETALAARARCYADLYELRRSTRGWTRSAPAQDCSSGSSR
jgi:aminoglycoside 2''-phosphotransferase